MPLLSKIPGDPTVGSFRVEKENCSYIVDYTWAPVSGVFDKLHDVGVSSYLFYSWFKCFVDVCVGLRS